MIWLLTHPLLSDFPVIGGITHLTCAYIQAENTSTRKKESNTDVHSVDPVFRKVKSMV